MLDTKPILAAIFQDDHEALKTMLKTLEPNDRTNIRLRTVVTWGFFM